MDKRFVAACGVALLGFSTTLIDSPLAYAAKSVPLISTGPVNPSGPMNWFNPDGLAWVGLNAMPLAFSKNDYANTYFPGLASKWMVSKDGRVVTVWLRDGMKWSDGTPITVFDVQMTFELEMAISGNAGPFGAINIVSSDELVFHEAVTSHTNSFASQVLSQVIMPSHIYGIYFPSNMWNLIGQEGYQGKNQKQLSQAKAAQSALQSIASRVESISPKTDISAGPFVVVGANQSEAVLQKNADYYDAKHVNVHEVILHNVTDEAGIQTALAAGQLDQATLSLSPDIQATVMKTKGNEQYTTSAFSAPSLLFNEKDYPYNLPLVRQALAYVIDRNVVTKAAVPGSGVPAKWLDGLTDAVTGSLLTKAELAKMNAYSVNTSTAAKLLQQAGCKQVKNAWILPNGKPWTATIAFDAGRLDYANAAPVIAQELTAFGIPTTTDAVPNNTYASAQTHSAYALSMKDVGQGPQPADAFLPLFGVPNGYSWVSGKVVRKRDTKDYIDFPFKVSIPLYGNLYPGLVVYQLRGEQDSKKLRLDEAKLALAANQDLVAITLWNAMQTGYVNTMRFTDFPLNSPQVLAAGSRLSTPIGLWIALGYIKSVKAH